MHIPKELLRITCFSWNYLGICNTYLESNNLEFSRLTVCSEDSRRAAVSPQSCSAGSVLTWGQSTAEIFHFKPWGLNTRWHWVSCVATAKGNGTTMCSRLTLFLWCGPSCPHHCSSKCGKKKKKSALNSLNAAEVEKWIFLLLGGRRQHWVSAANTSSFPQYSEDCSERSGLSRRVLCWWQAWWWGWSLDGSCSAKH